MKLQLNESNTYELLDEFNDIHKALLAQDNGEMAKAYSHVIPAHCIEAGYDCLLFVGLPNRPTEVTVRVQAADF